ncbi:MerR family transcriptional regulator [Lacticaseibacillus saniviri]|uniref:HTH merR-type domain-containing protein n=1 Tax=Lacticaseibacillus saniviri JCM 17471 = DSM 24301 TaxID=1293598 RepID=A0A0R2MN93_9LACO|nr:MerR family transcriptional regulator [Lacticaseibacillus saniviri]KRO15156.1 hypothetical protein IV56_GL000247 [Lacticaseibacillus saniviri JCM 17471 = DSM 24301]MCG4281139.1 MerR family transcriptional regulator [Lacticaseibacillus saniviri]
MYTIAEVAQKFHVSKNTLRYYESVNLLPSIQRDDNGIRHYSEADLEAVNRVVHMRRLGASVKEALWFDQEMSQANPDYDEGIAFLRQLDATLDQKIAEIAQQKEFLTHKIDMLQQQKQGQLNID